MSTHRTSTYEHCAVRSVTRCSTEAATRRKKTRETTWSRSGRRRTQPGTGLCMPFPFRGREPGPGAARVGASRPVYAGHRCGPATRGRGARGSAAGVEPEPAGAHRALDLAEVQGEGLPEALGRGPVGHEFREAVEVGVRIRPDRRQVAGGLDVGTHRPAVERVLLHGGGQLPVPVELRSGRIRGLLEDPGPLAPGPERGPVRDH